MKNAPVTHCYSHGCGRPVLARGLCPQHYQAWRWRHGKPCSVPGCSSTVIARSLCPRHYDRLRRLGDSGALIPARDLPAEVYFWSRVAIAGPDDCWLWKGSSNYFGYGQVSVGRRPQMAHRIALGLDLGRPVKTGSLALHRCDNPPCCNPRHLYEGSAADNANDRVVRGRSNTEQLSRTRIERGVARGERNPRAKLDRAKADEIRRKYAAGHGSQQTLANEYGVDQTLISRIVRGLTWND